MARQLEKAETKHGQEAEKLAKLKAKMEKMRANCSHTPVMDEEDGLFLCKDCGAVIGYTKAQQSLEDAEYEE